MVISTKKQLALVRWDGNDAGENDYKFSDLDFVADPAPKPVVHRTRTNAPSPISTCRHRRGPNAPSPTSTCRHRRGPNLATEFVFVTKGTHSLQAEPIGTANYSVGDFLDTEKGKLFIAFHDDLIHQDGFDNANDITQRIWLDFELTPSMVLPANYTREYIDNRLDSSVDPDLWTKKLRNSTRRVWCCVVSMIARRILFRLLPECQCGATSCNRPTTATWPTESLRHLEFDHFRCSKAAKNDEPRELFAKVMGGVTLEKIKCLKIIKATHHNRVSTSTHSQPTNSRYSCASQRKSDKVQKD